MFTKNFKFIFVFLKQNPFQLLFIVSLQSSYNKHDKSKYLWLFPASTHNIRDLIHRDSENSGYLLYSVKPTRRSLRNRILILLIIIIQVSLKWDYSSKNNINVSGETTR